MDTNSSLIMSLYESMYGKKENTHIKKYAETTQTLYHDKNLYKDNNNTIPEKTIIVQPQAYKRIVCGIQRYLFVDRKDFMLNEEIRIVEDNSKIHRSTFKTILTIETPLDNKGISDGYIILGF